VDQYLRLQLATSGNKDIQMFIWGQSVLDMEKLFENRLSVD